MLQAKNLVNICSSINKHYNKNANHELVFYCSPRYEKRKLLGSGTPCSQTSDINTNETAM